MARLTHTADIASKICARLAAGESLRSICRDEGMPPASTVMGWVVDNVDNFAEQYARARQLGMAALEDELMEIADDGRNDWMEKFDKDGNSIGYVLNGEHVQRSKLRVDTRKWLMAKIAPKKYGEKVDVNHGGQADNPISALLQLAQGSALPLAKTVEGEVIEGDDD